MLTELVRVGCRFLSILHWLDKISYRFYISIFSYMTLDNNPGSDHQVTDLLCVSGACHRHFLPYPILLPHCQETLANLS